MGGYEELSAGGGLFALEKKVGSGWCWRSVAQRLSDGSSLVISPIAKTVEGAAASLESVGAPGWVLAPNHFHHAGVGEVLARWPNASVIATSVAAPRLAKHGLVTARPEALSERLPAGVRLLEPPGLKSGECWLSVESERGLAWVVCDAFFNVTVPLSGAMGVMLRATGTAPGLRIGSTFRWLAFADPKAYRSWLEAELAERPPSVLVPAHGDVIEDDDLGARLLELVRRRV